MRRRGPVRAAYLKAAIRVALIARATERAKGLGHVLTPLTQAKRSYGPDASRAICRHCGRVLIIQPQGDPELADILSDHPSIRGEVLSERCADEPDPDSRHDL